MIKRLRSSNPPVKYRARNNGSARAAAECFSRNGRKALYTAMINARERVHTRCVPSLTSRVHVESGERVRPSRRGTYYRGKMHCCAFKDVMIPHYRLLEISDNQTPI